MSAGGKDALLARHRPHRSAKVADLLREVHRQAPKAKVLVIGYPQIVSPDDTCRELPLARGDYAYAEKVNLALTEMLRKAAEATGHDVRRRLDGQRGPRHLLRRPVDQRLGRRREAGRALPPLRRTSRRPWRTSFVEQIQR